MARINQWRASGASLRRRAASVRERRTALGLEQQADRRVGEVHSARHGGTAELLQSHASLRRPQRSATVHDRHRLRLEHGRREHRRRLCRAVNIGRRCLDRQRRPLRQPAEPELHGSRSGLRAGHGIVDLQQLLDDGPGRGRAERPARLRLCNARARASSAHDFSHHRRAAGNHAAAQADLAVIDHRRLAWCHRPLRIVELQRERRRRPTARSVQGGIGLAVTRLRRAARRPRADGPPPSSYVVGRPTCRRLQPRVVVALHARRACSSPCPCVPRTTAHVHCRRFALARRGFSPPMPMPLRCPSV